MRVAEGPCRFCLVASALPTPPPATHRPGAPPDDMQGFANPIQPLLDCSCISSCSPTFVVWLRASRLPFTPPASPAQSPGRVCQPLVHALSRSLSVQKKPGRSCPPRPEPCHAFTRPRPSPQTSLETKIQPAEPAKDHRPQATADRPVLSPGPPAVASLNDPPNSPRRLWASGVCLPRRTGLHTTVDVHKHLPPLRASPDLVPGGDCCT
ncbi:hypothetical protein GGTG_00052 [Gaeumannomyces tritici R3-111a-1]|uniref:Uncharacterized protein n=1 Tax=Gaeumannomyces tritici (strain R3-111a-1) TaxID=644352 RepID=J3NFK6_GAET3|nr:hypothetical protein GGTG_00052 [Gaeumannomyces tritici R3-111a-1]EJT80046.1 hypothetical protein GGTG_00052 [Gaeumannomyces tritici R3-111a-1]